MSLLNAFTTQMESFSGEICQLYPNDADLRLGHNMIILLKKTNPRKILDIYDNYVLDYRTQIDEKNESFFIDHDFDDVAEKNQNQEMTFTLVEKIKEYWKDLTPQNKEISWKYFQVLNKLSDKIKKN